MDTLYLWLPVSAFILGSCPFSLWLGRLFLHRDIRRYGDGNPGATNVFRAGSTPVGMLAVTLDIAKGVPFVFMTQHVFHLPLISTVGVAFAAMLGHAISPWLHFKGGKALAVTAGAVIGLTDATVFWSFFLSALLFFAILEDRPWIPILTPIISLAFLLISGSAGGYLIFMLGVFLLFAGKHVKEIEHGPRLKPRLASIVPFRKSA